MPQIIFDSIPDLRIPLVSIEFSNRLAGQSSIEFKALFFGQRLITGTVAEGVPTRIFNADEAETFWGRGSMLHIMFMAIKKANPFFETWGIALDDAGAGVAATKTITVTGPATAAGSASIYIGGKKISVAIADTDADAAIAIATAIAAAITADTALPFTAAAALAVVTLTARNKGEVANDIDIRDGYYGEVLPTGVTLAYADGVAGATNPDITTALAALGDEWYNWAANPWTDATNRAALETELDARYGPLKQIGMRVFDAFKGNLSDTATFGNGRNNPHCTTMGTNTSPTPPYIWASVNAVVAANRLAIDPARQLRAQELVGVLPPAIEDRWDNTERNSLLYDGIATYTVTVGKVFIKRQITNYQKNDLDIADNSYLDINVPEISERIRFEKIALFSLKYPDWKLAEDTARPSANTMQPKIAKAELLVLYRSQEDKGWVQDYEGYKATLNAQVGDGAGAGDLNRLAIYDSPKYVKNLIGTAMHSEFR